ncbi:MAG: NifU family protein [Elusimicrobiaceae bacterium]|jgi:Fe-S cluster biogenesis protein NfuA|nr:NifU family protein [Elusimicrobiaceae bacterium]MBT3955586.1 NifU family protein [Elusimicrobiaceae bacterium]MBT4008651.1 NifU family protein [Elusimicrobiaceae bacterium]MBT4402741.1 NifU family protein [Elusimicrobiaceae bacterium]MBT4439624.1 NifU family protein [Elusimicrobiaceae bacterium]
MKEKVAKVIEEIRPFLQADGGDLELVNVDEKTGIVQVRLKGRCGCCPSAQMTLKSVVEQKIVEVVPEVKSVERVD